MGSGIKAYGLIINTRLPRGVEGVCEYLADRCVSIVEYLEVRGYL